MWRTSPRQVLARLHTVAATGLTSEAFLGRPRSGAAGGTLSGLNTAFGSGAASGSSAASGSGALAGSGAPSGLGVKAGLGAMSAPGAVAVQAGSLEPGDPFGLGPAPSGEALAARMDGLVNLLMTPTKAPALVLAAIVHAELMVIRPFGTADGIVARSAERLTLVEHGLDPKSLAAIEVGHLELPYAESLRAYLSGTREGLSTWVRHCASAIVLGVRETTAICEAMQRG